MKISSATSTNEQTSTAGREVVETITTDLDSPPDLAVLFMTPHFASGMEELVATIHHTLQPRHLIGCSAISVIGGDQEYEDSAAITLWAAQLPKATVASAHVEFEETPDGFVFSGLGDLLEPHDPTTMLLLGEPFSFPPEQLLARLREDHPDLQLLGGMASAAHAPGENRLFLGGDTHVDGAVAVALGGEVRVRPAVSQGCRPFGKPFVVTKSDRNLLIHLGGQPALEQLAGLAGELTTREQTLLRQGGLHMGIAIDASKSEQQRGDFLVRNVIGVDQESGALATTDLVRPGTTVQFHLRDADSATQDLDAVLNKTVEEGARPAGALVFTCNGRGQHLFQRPHHDAGALSRKFASLPTAGFFAAGELGPIAGQNFLHGYTASIALLEAPL